ncbi:MAG: substrate-binding domain-containing protein [Verrucomicrobia bacterium]|jgi:LacI family transcriptional regulator|nr:substrate-binding domain-containing protein [Verrucomicrobiota bacterium]MBT7065909.1 substrate-binding domain-containing protein [Verrucomicrobiota bacterium]MBT7701220.1 substrate-binding domain-containing protein [Verrucomicrobiota bacterium]
MNTPEQPIRVLFANAWWHQDIVNGTVRHAAERGWHVDLQVCMSGRLPERWQGDGIITMLGGDRVELGRLIDDAKCPAVSLNDNFADFNIPRISQDDAIAGNMAAEHFLERGFNSFAFYSHGLSPDTAERRYSAFAARLRQEGYETNPILWADARGKRADTWLNRQEWLRETLSTLPKPLAVFALNDEAATEVIEACLAESITVPESVAVLGMLDMAIFRNSTTIPLSSIQVDFDTITRVACDVLARMMDGEPPPAHPILFPPTGIASRRSTDTIAAHLPEVARAVRFMLGNYARQFGTDDIAHAAGVCKTLLYDAFASDMGQTPYAVLNRIRVDNAKRLLVDTSKKIETVAEECGFGNRINLHRHFKRSLGTSPAAFRKQEREKTRDTPTGPVPVERSLPTPRGRAD